VDPTCWRPRSRVNDLRIQRFRRLDGVDAPAAQGECQIFQVDPAKHPSRVARIAYVNHRATLPEGSAVGPFVGPVPGY
jgi:hypothetical protein